MPDPQIGQVPFDEAIRFFRQKLNISTKRWDDLKGEAHTRMLYHTYTGARIYDKEIPDNLRRPALVV